MGTRGTKEREGGGLRANFDGELERKRKRWRWGEGGRGRGGGEGGRGRGCEAAAGGRCSFGRLARFALLRVSPAAGCGSRGRCAAAAADTATGRGGGGRRWGEEEGMKRE
jgi:hypothetical protein